MKKIVITGGAGFIGCHAASRFAENGWEVVVVDDLSRPGSQTNWEFLQSCENVRLEKTNITDWCEVNRIFEENRDTDAVLHLAAQVAVTASVDNPKHDFFVNALGTFNVLEAVRKSAPEAAVIYASTNKVYGGLEGAATRILEDRYDFVARENGINEEEKLDFHSPYGCSKGAADQYVRDYSRIYGLKTFVLRQSCIYGTRQFGVEDQGWVAWFTIAAVLGLPVTIYGDGRQVRDLLWVDDLVDLYEACLEKGKGGSVYNAGGGIANRCSVREIINALEEITGRRMQAEYSEWRPGDQIVYYSDGTRARAELGWEPKVAPLEGLNRMARWVQKNADTIGQLRGKRLV